MNVLDVDDLIAEATPAEAEAARPKPKKPSGARRRTLGWRWLTRTTPYNRHYRRQLAAFKRGSSDGRKKQLGREVDRGADLSFIEKIERAFLGDKPPIYLNHPIDDGAGMRVTA